MCASYNCCTFVGRISKDPEQRFTASGMSVTTATIACNEKFKNKAGEMEEKVEWVNLVFWGKLSEIVSQYATKGKEILVVGRMQTRKWEDKEGQTRYTTEINCDKMQLLGGKSEGGSSEPRPAHGGGSGGANNQQYQESRFDPNDEIPFLRGMSFYDLTER